MRLARERAVLQEIEMNVMRELMDAVRKLEAAYTLAQTGSNRRKAAEQEIETLTAPQSNAATTDVLADAQNRRADAAIHHWRSLADFANALSDMHFKGTLLGYRNIVVDDTATAERGKDNRDASG